MFSPLAFIRQWRRPPGLWLRPLLALLTVLASLLHLERSPEVGGYGAGGLSALLGVHTGHPAGRAAAPDRLLTRAGLNRLRLPDNHCGVVTRDKAGWRKAADTHQHAAHCPFCLTSAFALEAGVAGLPLGPPPAVQCVQARPEARTAAAASMRHADARAPPFQS